MNFNYIGILRTLLNDNDMDNQKLSDSQYMSIVELESNVYMAASIAAQSIAAQYANKKKVNVRGISVENQQVYEHYMDLSKNYKLKADAGGGYVNDDGSITGSSPFGKPIVTGVTISDFAEAKADIDRVKNVFPKPISDVL